MSTDFINRDEKRLGVVAAAFLTGIAAAVAIGKPGHSAFLPPCPIHALTGFFCPGCGTTRALYFLLHGHPLLALSENALSMLLLPFVLYELGAVLTHRWPGVSARLRPWSLWTFLGVVILFAVLRNIPFSPYTMLAPTAIR